MGSLRTVGVSGITSLMAAHSLTLTLAVDSVSCRARRALPSSGVVELDAADEIEEVAVDVGHGAYHRTLGISCGGYDG